MEIKTNSQKETLELGQKFAKSLIPGDVVAISGELGAGKTIFVKGIALGLGIKKRIVSPTFTIVRTYKLKSAYLHHIDLYRGNSIEDFETLGLPEIFANDAIVVIEWAQRIKKHLPKKRKEIKIQKTGKNSRKILIDAQPNIKVAAKIINSGGILIFPTDTVYGIGAKFDDKDAVDKIHNIKGTPDTQPFPVLVESLNQAQKIAQINNTAHELIKKHWPGGLTIVTKPKDGKSKIGLRQPNHEELLAIIRQAKTPIIGTSANFHGNKTSASFQDLDSNLVALANYLYIGSCKKGIESTVVDTTVTPPKILRQGAVSL
ncbi:MAG: L-threonylcarbamoyladenylate synthase [Candidatus Curtissbacteria bacterium]|nr:L-threonylcarbamoyladenylate synthase [Candidatus Curtissbacteria bacterium]